MEVQVESRDTAIIFSVDGRIDQNTAAEFQKELLDTVTQHKGSPVVVDLSAVDFVSSVGLRALMIALKQTQADGGSLSIAALTPTVREVFEISRFDTIFSCFETLDAALAEAHG